MKQWMYDSKLDSKSMKPYKGYQIDKSWKVDSRGRKIPNTDSYMVIDEDDDWIGDVYNTLSEAKAYIDEITASSYVTAAKKGTVRAWVEFQKWYDGLTSEQRDKVDEIADEEGLPDYEECGDDEFAWLKDEAEIVFKWEGYEKSTDEIPEELSSRPVVFMLNSVNSTYNDDILEAAEKFGAIRVKYGTLEDDGTYYSPDQSTWRFAVSSKKVAQNIFNYVKKSKIPVNQKSIITGKVDWSKAYEIWVDDYSEGSYKLEYHANDPKKVEKRQKKANKVNSSTLIKAGMGVGERVVYHLVDYPDTDPIYNMDTGRPYCFDSEEKAQAFIDENSEYWHEKYPGIRPRSKRIYNVWHD